MSTFLFLYPTYVFTTQIVPVLPSPRMLESGGRFPRAQDITSRFTSELDRVILLCFLKCQKYGNLRRLSDIKAEVANDAIVFRLYSGCVHVDLQSSQLN